MQTFSEITTPWWQPALGSDGDAVQGLDDIEQSIALILSIAFGQVPLAPSYYSDLQRWIDRPVALAAPQLASEAIDAVRAHEPRVSVDRVALSRTPVPGRITFEIVWSLRSDPTATRRTSQIAI